MRTQKKYYTYILTNKAKTVLYIGVTGDLDRRLYEHKNHLVKDSFTDTYNVENCIYYEEYTYINQAIAREKELKGWTRARKEALINAKNPNWDTIVSVPEKKKPLTWQEEYANFLKEEGIPFPEHLQPPESK